MKLIAMPTPGVSRDPYQDGRCGIYRGDLTGDDWQRNQQGLHERDRILNRHIEELKSVGLTRNWPAKPKED